VGRLCQRCCSGMPLFPRQHKEYSGRKVLIARKDIQLINHRDITAMWNHFVTVVAAPQNTRLARDWNRGSYAYFPTTSYGHNLNWRAALWSQRISM
jgi:hypothetical protein